MTAPFIGHLSRDDHHGLCGYSLNPGDPLCLAEATWHGIFTNEHGEVAGGLACCDKHKPTMRALAHWIHRLEVPCGLPEAHFFEDVNLCAIPFGDDDLALMAGDLIEVQP